VKSLPLEVAMAEGTMVAFEMNGEPLPHWNGGPARLVVPGWTGTYWVKQLSSVRIVPEPEKNFWMAGAYRVPKGKFNTLSFKSQVREVNEPITTMVVNSLITSVRNAQRFKRGQPILVRGLAWDGGSGIAKVEVSADGGASWQTAKLGKDLGPYSFREFTFNVPSSEPGERVIMAKATSKAGETQADELVHNPAGYHHNVPQKLNVEVV
jgi:hypothetical protein